MRQENSPSSFENDMKNSLSVKDFYDAKEFLSKAAVPPANIIWGTACNSMSFDTLQCSAPCQKAECIPVDYSSPNKIGNNPMYVDNDKHIESSKINYLVSRASDVFYEKARPLTKTFNLDTPRAPQTAEDLVKAITDGNFQIKPKAEQNPYTRATDNIIWRAASVVPDQAGYDAAVKSLDTAYTGTKDMIAIGTPAEGLAAVKALEAWTPAAGTVAS